MTTATSVAASASANRMPPPLMSDDQPRDYPGLQNVVAYHDGYYSGGVPVGDAGFDALTALGVRTIISVDGAEPDVARAKARGLRYIHLPIGYHGFSDDRKLELVRATRDAIAGGPVYIHCHHGKHRSAGAAGTVVASLGWCSAEEAVARMKVSGAAPSYKGLYAAAESARVIPASVVDRVSPDFPEISRPTGFVRGMIEIDDAFEHLKSIEGAGWRVPKDYPDLVPVAEAARLADLLRLLAEGNYAQRKPADFAVLMQENAAHAQALEDMLEENGMDPQKLSAQFQFVAASCKDCHIRYRD